jgi:O-antigen/teichoic acid export membrane protein
MFSSTGRSFLQGLTRFFPLSISGILEGLFRLLFTILFLFIGLGLFGAVFPFVLSVLIGLIFTLVMVKDLIKGEKNEAIPEKKEILKFVFPVFLVNLATTSLITSDVILARHFLSPLNAGLYAALSTLGKIIFFAALPVTGVIFPMVSESQAARENTEKVILQGLLMIGVIILGAFLIFSFFPKLMVALLFGEKYFSMIPYVFGMTVVMSLYTINYSLTNIFLALKFTFSTTFVCVAAIAQIILIILFHQSIVQFIEISIIVTALLLISLLLYYVLMRTRINIAVRKEDEASLL